MVFSYRITCAAGLFACIGLMAYALYAQHVLGLEPCPLCIFQRVAVIATGVVFLAGFLHAPRGSGRWFYAGLAALSASVGAGIAARHVWLQSLPPEDVPACGPGLDYMLEAFPLRQVLQRVFSGSGECAEIDWTFLGLSMPVWTLLCFLALAAWGLLMPLWTRPRP